MLVLLVLDPAVRRCCTSGCSGGGGGWPHVTAAWALAQAQRGREPGLRRHIPPAALSGRPDHPDRSRWRARRPWSACRRIEGTVILAFDVSGSMAADDLKPTRMEAAKAAARDFVAAPAAQRADRRGGLQRQRLFRAAADQRPGSHPGRDQPPGAAARHLAGARHSQLRSTRLPSADGAGEAALQYSNLTPTPPTAHADARAARERIPRP